MKDRKIELPKSLGWFTTNSTNQGEREIVWYGIRFQKMDYSIDDRRVTIWGTATVRKETLRPEWHVITLFFPLQTVWQFTCHNTRLSGGVMGDISYGTKLASRALNHGIVLDRQFFEVVCEKPERRFAELQSEIDRTFFTRRLQSAKAA